MSQAEPIADRTPPLDRDERAELEWLRTENALLRTERDILVRVASGFADDANATLLARRSHMERPWTDQHKEAR
ncbi:hypothetical protein SAMN05216266_11491 [Amycolatopsis marina]|uniref:Transposase n=1 Tax=Amycolatopsis marina TaxID=490629 RepID=A0A1I1BHI8_9PSEU|nr:hypothetical protein [Amycolatopsis marina]SFB49731.1 hypothetical protein SAMN05216266_11491 [Amycolatopsis marina]